MYFVIMIKQINKLAHTDRLMSCHIAVALCHYTMRASVQSFMKGVTRMPYPHDGPPWTPQHTRALFRLFQTSAPPDFQRQVLERVAQRQHARVRRHRRWRSPLSWWSGGHAWGGGTLQLHRRWPRRVIATAGCCGLVLGTSVVWWALQTDPAVPSMPEVRMSRVERNMTFQAGDNPERTLPVSAPVPHLTAQKERHPPARLHPQRWRRTRSAPGKGTRFHPRPGSGQQAPG